MVLPVTSRPFFWGAQVLGMTAITLVLIWTIRFRGGFGWEDKDLQFNLHPIFMLLGFVVLNGEAIMSLRACSWIEHEDTRTTNHLFSHALAFLFGIYGLNAVFKSQKESNIANFHSLHSWIGIGIFVLYGILFVYTGTVFLFPQLVLLTHDYQGRIHGLLRFTGPSGTYQIVRVHPFMPPIGPTNERGRIHRLLRSIGLNVTNEKGRMYGFLRFLIPAGSTISEDLHDPPRIRGFMRSFNPIGGNSAMNNQKEQVAGRLCFYEPSGDLNRRNEQGRLYGISRFFNPGERLEPVNKELMIDSIESFKGTLELTRGWLPWHSVFGMVVYIVVVGNAALGFLRMLTILENSAAAAGVVPKYGSEAYLVNFTAISTVLFGVFVIFSLLGDPLILRVQTSNKLSYEGPPEIN